jgi:hypothetical protein
MNSTRVQIQDFFFVNTFDDQGLRFLGGRHPSVPCPPLEWEGEAQSADDFIFELENGSPPVEEEGEKEEAEAEPATAPPCILTRLNQMTRELQRSFVLLIIRHDQLHVFYSHGFEEARSELEAKMRTAQRRRALLNGMVDALSLSSFYPLHSNEDDAGEFEELIRIFHREQARLGKKIIIVANHSRALSPMLVVAAPEHLCLIKNARLTALRMRFGELSAVLASS